MQYEQLFAVCLLLASIIQTSNNAYSQWLLFSLNSCLTGLPYVKKKHPYLTKFGFLFKQLCFTHKKMKLKIFTNVSLLKPNFLQFRHKCISHINYRVCVWHKKNLSLALFRTEPEINLISVLRYWLRSKSQCYMTDL